MHSITTYTLLSSCLLVSPLLAHDHHHDDDHDGDHHHHKMLIREGHAGIALRYDADHGLEFFIELEHSHGGHGAHEDHDDGDHGDHGTAPEDAVFLVSGYGAHWVDGQNPLLLQVGMPGQWVYVIDQSPKAGVPFLGIETEELDPAQFDGNISISLHSITGPGEFVMFTVGTLGEITSYWNTVTDVHVDYFLPAGSHRHMFWGFSSEGIYELELEAKATLTGGQEVEVHATFVFQVGGAEGYWSKSEEYGEGWIKGDIGWAYTAYWPWIWMEEKGWFLASGPGGPEQYYWVWNDGNSFWSYVNPELLPWYWSWETNEWLLLND